MIQQLLEDARKAQDMYKKRLGVLHKSEFVEKIGQGVIKMIALGDLTIKEIHIEDSLLADKELLQNLLVDCINGLVKRIDKVADDIAHNTLF